ncbi:MAG: hypothetical protein JF616_02575 [Fibrobacteres bacterium]|nr:hypothetical protein [Fibrobacterota bacterium]
MFGIGCCARRAGAALCVLAVGASAQILVDASGARQMGMGKGGVALPDQAHGAAFNPALPALSYPWDKISLELHPDWLVLWNGPEWGPQIRQKSWNGPFTGTAEMGPAFDGLLRVPSLYLPRLGYVAFDENDFTGDWGGRERVRVYALTLCPAVDFLGEKEGRTTRHAWSFGLTLKSYKYDLPYVIWEPVPAPGSISAEPGSTSGFAFDLGAAGRSLPKALPGVRIDWGIAFANLGPPYSFFHSGPYDFDPLDMRYRAGYSLAYSPFRGTRFPIFRVLVQQEFSKIFSGYDSDRVPYPFYQAFYKDLDAPISRYWRETESHTGLETTWFGLVNLRAGRSMDRSYGEHPWYTFGYGLESGRWLGPAYLKYDYGRELGTRERRRDNYFPLRREYGLQAGWRF